MEKPLKIRLHVLSPIHIGCDDVYEPTSFIIDENRKKLIEFDPIAFIRDLNSEQSKRFSNLCAGDDLLSIFKFIKNTYNRTNPLKEVDVSTGLVEHYKKVLAMSSYNKNIIINQFTLDRTSYNPQTNEVYIPGTSIKGAIRTAYLSFLASQKGIKGRKDNAKQLEIELLMGKFETDPFRLVKISDFQPLDNISTRIIYAVNKKKGLSDKETKAAAGTGPQQIFEVIESGSIFEGVINIDEPESSAGIKTAIEQKSLFKALNYHYKRLFDQEMHIVEDCGFKKISTMAFQDRFGDTCFLIRLGRHSGAEAVTIEGNRNIKINLGKGRSKYTESPTTLWLASEYARPKANDSLIPFGWAVFETLPFDPAHGLFSMRPKRKTTSEIPEKKADKQIEAAVEKPIEKKKPENIKVEGVTLIYSPSNKSLTTTVEGKKAFVEHIDDSFVPEHLWPKLKKHKTMKASILVEPVGNAFRIVKITG